MRVFTRTGGKERSKTVALPLVGLISPSRSLMSVDFPEPFGPTKPMTPGSLISRSSPFTATVVPKCRLSFSVRMIDILASGIGVSTHPASLAAF